MKGHAGLRIQIALALCWFAFSANAARPQQSATPAETSPAQQGESPQTTPFKLRVYANLVQVPTLILDPREKLPPPIARESFEISLDSGRVFHPTQMRMEGNDPIALGILLDAGGDQSRLLAPMAEALFRFAQNQLREGDTVTLYAVDCKVMRNLVKAAPEPDLIRAAVLRLLAAPGLHGEKSKPACGNALPLWDAVAYAANALGTLPGRRVLLVVSAGNEAKSKLAFRAAAEFLCNQAVALFGLRDPDARPMNVSFTTSMPGRPGSFGPRGAASSGEDAFDLLCAQNGGIVLSAREKQLDTRLADFATLLRGRYILEFPRPEGDEPGLHAIAITIPGRKNYMIRPTGVPIALPDPSLMNDPNTLRSKPSPATYGPRKVLAQPNH